MPANACLSRAEYIGPVGTCESGARASPTWPSAGWFSPRTRATGHGTGGTGTAFLCRTGDLDDLAADRGIDWEAVRATPKGHRSLLARSPSTRRGAGTGSPAPVSAAADDEAVGDRNPRQR